MRKELAIKLTNNYNAMPSVSSLIIYHTHRLMNIEVDDTISDEAVKACSRVIGVKKVLRIDAM